MVPPDVESSTGDEEFVASELQDAWHILSGEERVEGFRLLPRADHLAASLSYANRRRTEIARALATQPKLLLLDEPTAGMNPAETLELADQIQSLNRNGLTILLIEHKLDVVAMLADRVIVLDHGEKIAEGPPEVVRRHEEVIRAYLGRSAAFA